MLTGSARLPPGFRGAQPIRVLSVTKRVARQCRGAPCPFTRRRATARSNCSGSICKTAPTCTSASTMTARPSTSRELHCPTSARPRGTPSARRTPFPLNDMLCRCDGGNIEVVKILLANQADVNQPDTFNQVLLSAPPLSATCWHVVAAAATHASWCGQLRRDA
jgi:hypothetical protein